MYRFRAYPSSSQQRQMEGVILDACGRFYNHLLAARMDAHRSGRSLGFYEQMRHVKIFRDADEAAAQCHTHTLALVVSDLQWAWRSWLRRGAKGERGPRPKAP